MGDGFSLLTPLLLVPARDATLTSQGEDPLSPTSFPSFLGTDCSSQVLLDHFKRSALCSRGAAHGL